MTAHYQSVFREGLFAGQAGIVTGAGSGIGRCTAHGGVMVTMIADMWSGMPLLGHAGAARAGMLNLTETAALEWAPVRVNAVAPGWIASSGLDQYPPELRERFKTLPRKVPLGRIGTESEVSAAIVFLLSPAAAFISGSCVRTD